MCMCVLPQAMEGVHAETFLIAMEGVHVETFLIAMEGVHVETFLVAMEGVHVETFLIAMEGVHACGDLPNSYAMESDFKEHLHNTFYITRVICGFN